MIKPRKRKRAKADGGLVPAILGYLATQQEVIEAQRVNSGAIKVGERFISLAKAGSFDIRLYFRGETHVIPAEIEAKRIGKPLNANQLKRVRTVLNPGRIPWCRAQSVTDVIVFMGELRAMARVA